MVHLFFQCYVVGCFIYPSFIVGKERSRQTYRNCEALGCLQSQEGVYPCVQTVLARQSTIQGTLSLNKVYTPKISCNEYSCLPEPFHPQEGA